MAAARRLGALHGAPHHVVQVHPVGPRVDGPRLDAREVEQVVDQARQPLRLLVDHGDQLAAVVLVEVAVGQRVGRRADGRQRRAQVVRDRMQHRCLGHVGAPDGLGLRRLDADALALEGHVEQPGERLEHALDLATAVGVQPDRRTGDRDAERPLARARRRGRVEREARGARPDRAGQSLADRRQVRRR